jgi:hypothetical protein
MKWVLNKVKSWKELKNINGQLTHPGPAMWELWEMEIFS